jgi:hypothetical protein
MLVIARREGRRARTMPRRSPLTRVTLALSMATSVPVPMAMPYRTAKLGDPRRLPQRRGAHCLADHQDSNSRKSEHSAIPT